MTKCYISDDFSAHMHALPDDVIKAPEQLLNGKQLRAWVADLHKSPKVFATCSLYLLREMYLQKIKAVYINLKDDGVVESDSFDDLMDIEVLDRDLEQSDRFIDASWADDPDIK